MKAALLSWVPVERGPIYCSPACGGRCTKAAFEHATAQATALASQLGGLWQPRVWENLGWLYRVEIPGRECSLSPLSGGYWCSLGLGGMQFTATASTPERALQLAAEKARRVATAIETELVLLS